MIKNKYLASHAAQLKAVEEELAKDRNVAAALKGSAGELPGPSMPHQPGLPFPHLPQPGQWQPMTMKAAQSPALTKGLT